MSDSNKTYNLFSDELLQNIFIDATKARAEVLICMSNGGNTLYCRDQLRSQAEILQRIPTSTEILDKIEAQHNDLFNKISGFKAEIVESQDLIVELESLSSDASNRYDDLILQGDKQAQDDADVQLKEWADNIASIKKRIAPYQRAIDKTNSMMLVVERMKRSVSLALVTKEVRAAEEVFNKKLKAFAKDYKQFVQIASKTYDVRYNQVNMLSFINEKLKTSW